MTDDASDVSAKLLFRLIPSVPETGLEPAWIAPPDPKSGASTNFATLAFAAGTQNETMVRVRCNEILSVGAGVRRLNVPKKRFAFSSPACLCLAV